MPATKPSPGAKVICELKFHFPNADEDLNKDWGYLMDSFEFKGWLNGGYIVRARLADPHFEMFDALTKYGYLLDSRGQLIEVQFRLSHDHPTQTIADGTLNADNRERSTQLQRAYIIALETSGDTADMSYIEFVAIDPPSWFLNCGNSAGTVHKGSVGDVILEIVQRYAPQIDVEVGETRDSTQGKWYMMRQDPKAFLQSLFEWSSSITEANTNWIVAMDGMPDGNPTNRPKIVIREQADWTSKQRAYYRFWGGGGGHNTVKSWSITADHALSIVETSILTQGMSTISGKYFDRITDGKKREVWVNDQNTPGKIIPLTDNKKAFTKSTIDTPPIAGSTSVMSIPEHSAGDLGIAYGTYIDGKARNIYLSMLNNLMRAKIKVIGHGEWSNSFGLGVDTIFLKWFREPGTDNQNDTAWFASGNWLVYGFHHIANRNLWYTDLYLSRAEWNATGQKVGAGA